MKGSNQSKIMLLLLVKYHLIHSRIALILELNDARKL